MNKKLIPVLLIMAAFAGCTSKNNNGAADTTNKPASSSTRISPNTASSAIMPPAAAFGPGSNIVISTQLNLPQANVIFYIGFLGPNAQTITIRDSNNNVAATFNSNNGKFFSFPMQAPSSARNITVSASLATGNYSSVTNAPVKGGFQDTVGYDGTAYIDSNIPPDTAVVFVVDGGIINHP